MIGQNLGPYEIQAEIGRGGMGNVYRAVQPSLGRTVAVKTLLPHLVADKEFIERFQREARATAKLSHPGIVTIYDVGEQDGIYYFAMEYLPGQTLDEVVRGAGVLSTDSAVRYVSQIADALGHAHGEGILHRDVKPSNVLVDRGDRAVLTDFGIARAASDSRLTRTGTAVGSPDYMSPEQVEGGQQDQRSDLYSLGVLFYQLLTGDTPYHGETPMSVAFQHVNGPVKSPREENPAVPVHVDAIVRKLLAKKPADRYGSAEELLVALGIQGTTAITDPNAPTVMLTVAGKRRPLGALLAVLAVLGVGLTYGAYRYFGAPGPGTPTPGTEAAPGDPALGDEQRDAAAADDAVGSNAGGGEEPRGEDGIDEPETSGDDATSGLAAERNAAAGDSVNDGEPPSIPGAGAVTEPTSDPARPDEPDTDVGVESEENNTEVAAGANVETGAATAPSTGDDPQPAAEVFTVTSRPAGATVTLDGASIEGVTPATLDLLPGQSHRIGVELEGYESTGFEFTLDDLDAAQRDNATLHFPLRPSTPPGSMRVRATYAVSARIGERAYEIPAGGELSLQPGSYEVTFEAPDVYLRATRQVKIESDTEATVVLPATVSVTIATAPAYCRIQIDGRDVGFVPVTLDIAVGEHDFVFDWERLGESRSIRRAIRLDTDRIFESASDGGAD